ncbi:DNA-binding transcriptional response regulator [Planctomycetes bacterium Poly30]|uniref:DNA-binding transcriptional response regulator n=1 Tax=Saltatorellus ferox TaxID=2528018 RepID=A0A518EST4_9BACT|nr:DNA-binding transcriptional response regulator [Planctomycetes bacterium Poly30]
MSSEGSGRVLVVDDDLGHGEALGDGLEMDGYDCVVVGSGSEGIAQLEAHSFDAVLTDLVMHDRSGLEVLREAKRLAPDTPVLLVTGHATVETAVDAMREGAEDYLSKPVKLTELRAKLARAVEKSRLRKDNETLRNENVELRRQFDKSFGFEGLHGRSPEMIRVFEILARVAPTDATVLILGESGTGKELIARAIHTNSKRAKGNFVAVNCAALTEGLIESELFGHVKGAFTGAVADKEGRIAYANGGTLFLDEIGDMPLVTQAKMLRVLEAREVVQVGGNEPRKVDIRLVAATNRDLREMVKAGTFREDLFHRLQVVELNLPPLRDRAGDIPLLIDHFVAEFRETHCREITGIAPEARALLGRYPWPGNVRELRNALENMVLLAGGAVLVVDDVPEGIRRVAGGARSSGASGASNGTDAGGSLPASSGGYDLAGRSHQEVEKALILANLELMEGNRKRAAEVLGIGERTLYRKLKEYGMT